MKRSEANAILQARIEFSREYHCVSAAPDADEYFSHSGCDVCPDSLAGTVIDVTYLAIDDTEHGNFARVYEGQMCGGCLCSLVNGDDSDLDYHVTDEDEPALSVHNR